MEDSGSNMPLSSRWGLASLPSSVAATVEDVQQSNPLAHCCEDCSSNDRATHSHETDSLLACPNILDVTPGVRY